MTFPLLTALRMIQAEHAGAEVVTSDGRALPLRGVSLKIDARGGIARAVLEQRYANPYDEALHVTYRMPLPADGAVCGYAFEIGDRRIVGVVDRKAAAREKFERAIASGHTAALLEQDRDDIFTQKIGNIPPRETIVARIAVDMRLAWLPEGEWELRFPTVIGPRYISEIADSLGKTGVPSSIEDARATNVKTVPSGTGVRIGMEVSIGDALIDGRKPTSPTHKLDIREGGVALSEPGKLDRDIVIRWPVASAKLGMSVNIARPVGRAEAYGLVTIVPPSAASKAKTVSRDLLILLDTSGSMGGAPLDKAKQVLPLMIESLGEGDRLEMIEFSNSPRRYKEGALAATPKEKAEAIKWIRSRKADGGTEMRAAVIEALSTLRLGAQRQVVLVTDGYVGGEQQILEVLHAKLPRSCRLHVLGVGSAVNRSLAIALARAGRGAEVLVGPDEDAERGAKRLLDRTKLPMLTNVELAGTALVRHVPAALPDVFGGSPLVAAVELRPEGGVLVVKGDIAGGESWEERITVRATLAGDGEQAIVSLFGRERVADLEARAACEYGEHDRAIEEIGVMFQISTRLTSWVAVDESRIVKAPVRETSIPQELPYGTHAASFGLRAGSMVQPEPMPAQMDFGEDPSAFSDIDDVVPGSPMKTMMLGSMPMQPSMKQRQQDEAEGGDFDAEEVTGSAQMEQTRMPAQEKKKEAPSDRARPRMVTKQGGAAPSPKPPAPQVGYAPPAPGSVPVFGRADVNELALRAVPPAKMRSRSPWPLVLMMLFVLAVIAFLFWWLAF